MVEWIPSLNRALVAILLSTILLMPGRLDAQDEALFSADNVRLLRVLTLLQHDSTIIETSFSPGGGVFLTGTLGGKLQVWQAGENTEWTRGERRFSLDGYIPGVTLNAFDSDEARMATSLDGTTIEVRDLASGDLMSSFDGHAAPADSITFVEDGNLVVSTDFNGGAFIWDATSGEALDEFTDVVALSTDEQNIAVLSSDGTITLGPITAPEERITLEDDAARGLQFSPGGRWLAAWGDHLTVWETDSGDLRFRNRNLRADNAIWSPDSRFIITHSFDEAQVWAVTANAERELEAGDRIDEFISFADAGGLRQFIIAPDGGRAVTVDLTGVARLWRINPDGQVDQIRALQGLIDEIIISPDSATIVGFRQDFLTRFWNANGDLRGEIGLPDTLVFSPDWRLLASHSDEIVAWRGFTSDDLTFAFPPVGRPQGRSNLRPIPSDEIARIGGLDSTQGLFAIARTVDSGWFQIILEDGSTGWVSARGLLIEASDEFIAALPAVEVARTTPQNPLDDIPFLVAPEPAPLDVETGLTGCYSNRQVLILGQQEADGVTYFQVDCGDVTGWLAEEFLAFENGE